jgi:cytochrome c
MKMIGTLIFMLAAFGSFSAVHAEQFGTAEEARAMLDRAVAALNSNRTRALSEFNDTKNTQFHDRDLYISCYNMVDGKFTAFPSRAIIGADIREMKLQNDPVGQRAYDAIKGSPEGSIATMEYNFPKPGTDKPVLKESIEVRIGNQVCGVSYYK